MTIHELRIAVAEMLGWTDVREEVRSFRTHAGEIVEVKEIVGMSPRGSLPSRVGIIPDPISLEMDAMMVKGWLLTGQAEILLQHRRVRSGRDWVTKCEVRGPKSPHRNHAGTAYTLWSLEQDPARRERIVLCAAAVRGFRAGELAVSPPPEEPII